MSNTVHNFVIPKRREGSNGVEESENMNNRGSIVIIQRLIKLSDLSLRYRSVRDDKWKSMVFYKTK